MGARGPGPPFRGGRFAGANRGMFQSGDNGAGTKSIPRPQFRPPSPSSVFIGVHRWFPPPEPPKGRDHPGEATTDKHR